MKHKGTNELTTERLMLRRFRQCDLEDLFLNWANDSRVTEHLTWPRHESIEVSQKILEEWLTNYSRDDYYQWALVEIDSGKVIGSLGLDVNENAMRAAIGYCIGYAYWGKGYMTEALTRVMEYLFNEVGVQRVQAHHYIQNPASGKVMKKAGLKYEGCLKGYGKRHDGIFVDCDMYGLTKEEYEIKKKKN